MCITGVAFANGFLFTFVYVFRNFVKTCLKFLEINVYIYKCMYVFVYKYTYMCDQKATHISLIYIKTLHMLYFSIFTLYALYFYLF